MKTVRDVIPSCRALGCNTSIDQIYLQRKTFPKMFAKIVLACATEQAGLLTELWAPHVGTDIPVRHFWWNAVKTGRFIDFLDVSHPERVIAEVNNLNI